MFNYLANDRIYNIGHSLGSSLRLVLANISSASESYSQDDVVSSISRILSKDTLLYILNLPRLYKGWWINLVRKDPIHVFIETVLVGFIAYLLLFKSKRQKARAAKKKLTDEEKEELLMEWKSQPLVPVQPSINDDGNYCSLEIGRDEDVEYAKAILRKRKLENQIYVHKVDGVMIDITIGQFKKVDNKSSNGTKGKNGGLAKIKYGEEMTVLNMSSHDFLGMSSASDSSIRSVSRQTLKKYGCGSCGPRGFYGTVDVHLELESKIAQFCGTDSAIMYSDGASACSSMVAAFAKRGDLLVVDEGIYEPLQTGVTLSRAKVVYFKHNDMDDLRRVLEEIRASDEKLGRKQCDQRRFIIVEGLYKNFGHVVPMDKLVALKHEFFYRLIVDESFSFGTMGKTGKGIIEHHGKKFMSDVEVVSISLENSLGSIGGVCVGNLEVVDHQRLSGAGYCFSASAPPFVASAAIASLNELENNPATVEKLALNRSALYLGLSTIKQLIVTSDQLSSIVFVRLAAVTHDVEKKLSFEVESLLLDDISTKCLELGVVVVSTGHVVENTYLQPPPSIRLTISASHTKAHIDKAVKALRLAAISVCEVQRKNKTYGDLFNICA